MKKIQSEYECTAWGERWDEELQEWLRYECVKTGIWYEYIPTTRKEKIKKKLNDIGDEIFHLLFMIFFVPIGFIYFIIKEFIIKDLILKENNTKQKKVDTKQKKVDLNQSRQDKNEDDWEAW